MSTLRAFAALVLLLTAALPLAFAAPEDPPRCVGLVMRESSEGTGPYLRAGQTLAVGVIVSGSAYYAVVTPLSCVPGAATTVSTAMDDDPSTFTLP